MCNFLLSLWQRQNNSKWQLQSFWEVHWHQLHRGWGHWRGSHWAIPAGKVQSLSSGGSIVWVNVCTSSNMEQVKFSCGNGHAHSCAGAWGKKLSHLLLHADGHASWEEKDSFPWERFRVQLSDHGTVIIWIKHCPYSWILKINAWFLNHVVLSPG